MCIYGCLGEGFQPKISSTKLSFCMTDIIYINFAMIVVYISKASEKSLNKIISTQIITDFGATIAYFD